MTIYRDGIAIELTHDEMIQVWSVIARENLREDVLNTFELFDIDYDLNLSEEENDRFIDACVDEAECRDAPSTYYDGLADAIETVITRFGGTVTNSLAWIE